jgi:hypothetical protein
MVGRLYKRKWLEHLAKQLIHEAIIDSTFVNRAFSTDGGDKRLNKILGNHLDEVLEELAGRVGECRVTIKFLPLDFYTDNTSHVLCPQTKDM